MRARMRRPQSTTVQMVWLRSLWRTVVTSLERRAVAVQQISRSSSPVWNSRRLSNSRPWPRWREDAPLQLDLAAAQQHGLLPVTILKHGIDAHRFGDIERSPRLGDAQRGFVAQIGSAKVAVAALRRANLIGHRRRSPSAGTSMESSGGSSVSDCGASSVTVQRMALAEALVMVRVTREG